jgi:hypothetical protein
MCKEYCDGILCISRKIMCSHTCGKRFVHEELLSDVARRGWHPLNRGLLKSPEVMKTKVVMTTQETETTTRTPPQENVPPPAAAIPPAADITIPSHTTIISDITVHSNSSTNSVNNSTTNSAVPKSLNLTSGFAGEFVTGMLQYAIKNEKNSENLSKKYKEGKTLRESLAAQDNKRFTAGSLFKANRVAIDSELLEYMEEKELEVVRKQHATISKHTNEFLTNKKGAEEVLLSKKKPELMFTRELKTVVKWKKRKGDAALPSTKPLLLQRYYETLHRPDLTLAQYLEEMGMQGGV